MDYWFINHLHLHYRVYPNSPFTLREIHSIATTLQSIKCLPFINTRLIQHLCHLHKHTPTHKATCDSLAGYLTFHLPRITSKSSDLGALYGLGRFFQRFRLLTALDIIEGTFRYAIVKGESTG